jgi:alkanesulfonate monooxygenase SsuD/methylene tetrahydromethanopterin reductase-like flavin-dependent oxidoreductase (luciferase family)
LKEDIAMVLSLGYLLPTRELIMEGRHEAASTLALADRAERLGLDSVWVGDSVIAKPRHDPLTMLAAIAGRTQRIKMGTAVLLPLLRNPVVLAQQLATLDQISSGRLILGLGIGADQAAVRAEFEAVGVPFEKRVGRLLEAMRLYRALWSGEPVDWDGRWRVRDASLAPKPFTPEGPPLWAAGNVEPALKRAATYFDGWFPSGPSDAALWGKQWQAVQEFARAAGRDPGALTGAAYLTLSVDDDVAKADARLNTYLSGYYNQPADVIRRRQGCYAGTLMGATAWLHGFVKAGATHFALRFIGDHERDMEACQYA